MPQPQPLMEFLNRGRDQGVPNSAIQAMLNQPDQYKSEKPNMALPIVGSVISALLGNSNPVGAYSRMRGDQLEQARNQNWGENLSAILEAQGGTDFSRSQLGNISRLREAQTGRGGEQFAPQGLEKSWPEYSADGTKVRRLTRNSTGDIHEGAWRDPSAERYGGRGDLTGAQKSAAELAKQARKEWGAESESTKERLIRFFQGRAGSMEMKSEADQSKLDMYYNAIMRDPYGYLDADYLGVREDFNKRLGGDPVEDKTPVVGEGGDFPEMMRRPAGPSTNAELVKELSAGIGDTLHQSAQGDPMFGIGQSVGEAARELYESNPVGRFFGRQGQ